MMKVVEHDFEQRQSLIDALDRMKEKVKSGEVTDIVCVGTSRSGVAYWTSSVWPERRTLMTGALFEAASINGLKATRVAAIDILDG
jgi:hypothetical protein